MTFEDFQATLGNKELGESLPDGLRALWLDAQGDWHGAHTVAQSIKDQTGSLIHAYLHRKEGDLGNAGYWYSRAGRPAASDSLDSEWERIARELCEAG